MSRASVTRSLVRQLFDYQAGKLVRRQTKNCTKRGVGESVGCIGKDGYVYTKVLRQSWVVHRLVWLWHFEDLPSELDHVNGNPSDNRIENLRACTSAQNKMNRRASSRNSTGLKGVSFNKGCGKWEARIRENGRLHYLGVHPTPVEAAIAYDAAAARLHGNFVRLNFGGSK